tara:strand:+ start:489 stop:1397 length:909 start_codon:yes stop_codon:yes gene_type:complete
MDPLEGVKPHKDTTYFLMLAAYERGYEVFFVDPATLSLRHSDVYAAVVKVKVSKNQRQPFVTEPQGLCALANMDAVWIRQDPPFDRSYFYVTLLLDQLPERVQIINKPVTVRNWNEKLAALRYPAFTPTTFVSRSVQEIKQFLKEQQRITVKPVDGHGGKGIIFLDSGGKEISEQLDNATRGERHWVVAQQYLPAAREGDKRILLLDGEPLGAILRVHAEGVELNNLDQGGSAEPAKLDDRDRQICEAMRHDLVMHGVRFAGIDVIGGMLIEVNITSPTGLQEMSRFDKTDYHHRVMASFEA